MTKYEIVDAIIATKYPFISHHFFFSYLLLAIQFHSDVSRKSRTMCGVMCAKLAHDQSRMCTTPFNWDEQQREKTEDTLTEYSYILHVCAWNACACTKNVGCFFYNIFCNWFHSIHHSSRLHTGHWFDWLVFPIKTTSHGTNNGHHKLSLCHNHVYNVLCMCARVLWR